MKKILVLCCHDGITTFYCGVGKVVKDTLFVISELIKSNEFNYELHIFTPYVDRDSEFYRKNEKIFASKLAESTGGRLHEIKVIAGTKTKDINSNWGVDQWNLASRQVASFVQSNKDRGVIILLHDIYFALLCYYLEKMDGVSVCYIPHSTGKLFNEPFRLPSEKLIYRGVREKQYKIGYINNFIRKHLQNSYGVKLSELVPIKNALLISEIGTLSNDEINNRKKAEKCLSKIGKNKKIIFSFGRCSAQKGFHTLIDAYYLAKISDEYVLVLLAPVDITDKKYLGLIKSKLDKLPKNSCLFIKEFMSPLPFLMSEKLKMIVFSSQFECAPISALEALRHSERSTIIYSEIQPFKEIFKGLSGTKMVSRNNPKNWSTEINASIRRPFLGVRVWNSETYNINFQNLLYTLEKDY